VRLILEQSNLLTKSNNVRLLHAPYTPPVPRRGTPSRCVIRGRVTVVGWTDAKLSWPLCTLPGRGGKPTIQVDAELARAVRHEAATAIRHWWGVSAKTVAMWRRELGVRRADPEGSQRLIVAAAKAGGAGMAAREWSAAERRARRQRAIKLGLGPQPRSQPKVERGASRLAAHAERRGRRRAHGADGGRGQTGAGAVRNRGRRRHRSAPLDGGRAAVVAQWIGLHRSGAAHGPDAERGERQEVDGASGRPAGLRLFAASLYT
jgi:hypothetical protein